MSDIEKLIKEMIAAEVKAQVLPLIDRINGMSGKATSAADAKPAKVRRPRKPRDPNAAPRTVKPVITDAARNAVAKWTIGAAANYKQGRGDFNGKIIAIDVDKCTVTVKRDMDGKEVVRPADKVYAAK